MDGFLIRSLLVIRSGGHGTLTPGGNKPIRLLYQQIETISHICYRIIVIGSIRQANASWRCTSLGRPEPAYHALRTPRHLVIKYPCLTLHNIKAPFLIISRSPTLPFVVS